MIYTKTKKVLFTLLFIMLGIMTKNCTSGKDKADNFPLPSQYPDYTLIDARHTQTLALNVRQNQKLGIVVRDLAVTAFTNLDTPVYDKKSIIFEGVERCCVPNTRMLGASGLLVYKIRTLKKGSTTIKLIARHKGLNFSAEHYDSDLVNIINLNIE